jgi:glycosyltransferase involved in cell wall biosynthesis
MSSPIRVLHLAESPYFGGINAHIRSVVNAFREHDRVHIGVATLPGARADRWLFDALGGTEVYELPMTSRFDSGAAKRLREYVAAERYDIVHTHNYRATILASRANLPVPQINTCHGMIAEPGLKLRLYQALECRAMRRLACTIAVSNFVRNWLVRKGLAANQVRVVHNGYEPGPVATTLDRDSLGIPAGAVVYLFAGRLAQGKGVRECVEALRGIDRAFALIVGDGPLRAECEALARHAGVRAHFTGVQPDVAPYYRLADAVVLPSRMEALPMTLIEAAAHAKPAIATNAGGIPEVVADGTTGLLIAPGDAAQLHDALSKLTAPDLRTTLGSAAHAHWREHFTLDHMATALHALYTSTR